MNQRTPDSVLSLLTDIRIAQQVLLHRVEAMSAGQGETAAELKKLTADMQQLREAHRVLALSAGWR